MNSINKQSERYICSHNVAERVQLIQGGTPFINIQLFATKKGVGSSRNGRDSQSKRLGVKCTGGSYVVAGNIIKRQRGREVIAGENVGMGKDYTLFALKDGIVRFATTGKDGNKKTVSVEETK